MEDPSTPLTNPDTECQLCMNTLDPDFSLECGHHMHRECLENHFIQECPFCRTPQFQVLVKGKNPSHSDEHIDEIFLDNSDNSHSAIVYSE